MRVTLLQIAAAGIVAVAFSGAARADLLVTVDKSTQKMTVAVDGVQRYVWPVSTGVAEYDTPNGAFTPFRMEKDHFSKEWDDAPMPYSIFFTKQGHAIHGTNHSSIGRPASHGCVRLHVKDAAKLWALVKKEGMSHTHIVLTGEIPETAPAVAHRNAPRTITRDFDDGTSTRTFGHANADANVNDDNDDAVAVVVPRESTHPAPRYWRQYGEEPRYYYYRVRPYLPPAERHGRGFLTFGY
jgi:hypothetical protein